MTRDDRAHGARPGDADVLEAYARPSLAAPARWDEMVDTASGVRPPWRDLGSVLRALGPAGLAEHQQVVTELLGRDGVVYRPYGAQREQPWSLDPVPLLLSSTEWSELETALVQRSELLDLVLTDLYGSRRLITDGLLPPEIVFGHTGFVRAVDGIRVPGPRQLFLAATDLVRGPDGQWQVIGDRTQAPSGTGYAMAGRSAVARALTSLYRGSDVARLAPFFQTMRLALQGLAPSQAEVPRVVLLTSGAASETAFDQAFLASLLGFSLVAGQDLTVRDGRVFQRSIGRLEPVDVILRRVDAWFCDPVELRGDSQLGVPGLLEAARAGNVSIVNGIGSGVLENPALYPYLPRLCEVLLGEPLRMPSVQTWWCGDETARRHVVANLHRLVVKQISRQVVHSSRLGWELSADQRAELARWIEAEPHTWVAQHPVAASSAPSAGASGLQARPLALRSFTVADGARYRAFPGGLARTALDADAAVVTSQDGAVAKDVWVLTSAGAAAEDARAVELVVPTRVATAISPRVAADLFWLGRYAERAEDMSRLVAIVDNRWRDAHPTADPAIHACVGVLIDTLFATANAPDDPLADQRTRFVSLLTDATRPGTVAHDVRRVRELADTSRDQLSTDTWTVLRGLDRGLTPFGSGVGETLGDVAAATAAVREALLAFAGLAAESMVRDAGWYFLDAGRRLERALQLAGLVNGCLVATHGSAVDGIVEESVLIAAESIITFRRRYSARQRMQDILELVLFDRDSPRSLGYQLERLAADLDRIAAPAAPTEDTDPLTERAGAIVARLRATDAASLAVVDGSGRRAGLAVLLAALVDDLHALSDAMQATHFPPAAVLQQLVPMSGLDFLEPV